MKAEALAAELQLPRQLAARTRSAGKSQADLESIELAPCYITNHGSGDSLVELQNWCLFPGAAVRTDGSDMVRCKDCSTFAIDSSEAEKKSCHLQ